MTKPIPHLFAFPLLLVLASGPLAAFTDSDSDGLEDSVETNTGVYIDAGNTGTDPNNPDSDNDGAGDWYEVVTIAKNPSLGSPPNSPNDPALKPGIPYPLPDPDPADTGSSDKPVKVYILAGQSNMLGYGTVSGSDPGTLETMTGTENKFPNLVANAGGWSVRNDVYYRGVIEDTGAGPLKADVSGGAFGPELGFGFVMGYFHDEPVLLIKASKGAQRLGSDILPPGSPPFTSGSTTYAGYGDSPYTWPTGSTPVPTKDYGGRMFDTFFKTKTDWAHPLGWTNATVYTAYSNDLLHNGGIYTCKLSHTSSPATEPGVGAEWQTYWRDDSMDNVADTLDNFASLYPQWAAQGFEIAGFVWWQGHTDQWEPLASRYEQNLVRLIKQLRLYYGARYPGKMAADAPFVLATLAYNGWDFETAPIYGADSVNVLHGQLAVSGETGNYPEFAGNVKTAEARGYWRGFGPPGGTVTHYYHNAETYLLVGDALGRAMVDLQAIDSEPPSPDPMSFAIAPSPMDPSTVGMVAATATDPSGPVEYYFENTGNGQFRDWSTDPRWENTGLAAGSYSYRVKARDAQGNETGWSNVASASPGDDDSAPTPAPAFFGPLQVLGATSIAMSATPAQDIHGVEYFFECTTGGGPDSSWQPGTQFTAISLSPNTSYTYVVRARDSVGNTTADSSPASATTDDIDSTPPQLMSRIPGLGASDVPVNSSLVMTFTEDIAAGSGMVTLRKIDDASELTIDITDGSQVSIAGDTLTIQPNANLASGATYAVLIAGTAIDDLVGNSFPGIADDTVWRFSTVAGLQFVDDSAFYAGTGWDANVAYTLPPASFGSFDPAGSDKLVVTVGGRALNDTTPLTVGSVTYNGVPMTEAVEQTSGRTVTAIYYLDSPPAAGDLVVTYDTASVTTAVSLLALSGTAPGVGPTNSSASLSTTLTIDPALVVACAASGHPATTISPQAPLTPTGLIGGYYFKAGSGYAEVISSGSFTATFTADGSGNATAAAAFGAASGTDETAPTPNPMTFAGPLEVLGETSISMTATTAQDPSGVEYFFECTVGGGPDSGWQPGTQFTATGLSPDTAYTYVVRAKDSLGNTTAESDPASATTGAIDSAPPQLISRVPGLGASDVAAGTSLVLTFNENIAAGSGLVTLRKIDDGSELAIDITDGSQVSISGGTLTIQPATNLAAGTTYAVLIAGTAIDDLAGNSFPGIADDTLWRFTTASPPQGGITVADTATYAGTTYSPSNSFTVPSASFGSFDPAGTDKLVLTVGSRASADLTMAVASVTYNGVAMNNAVEGPAGRDPVAIFYLDDPPAAGDLVITFDPGTSGLNVAVSMISLNGTAAGVGPTQSVNGLSATLTTTQDVSLIVAASITSAANGLTITPQSPLIPVQTGTATTMSYAAAGSGYHELAFAGPFTASFSASGGTVRSTVVAAFAPAGSNPFATWITGFDWSGFTDPDLSTTGDPDKDGLANGIEAWFGTHPGEFNAGLAQIVTNGTTTTFTHPQNGNPPSDLTGYYEWSPNLVDWYAGNGVDGPDGGPTVTISPSTVGTITTVAVTASEATGRLFLRAGVIQN